MPTATKRRTRSRTDQLIATQNEILDLLRQDVAEWQRAGERIDRQHRANLQALAAIAQGQKDIAVMQQTALQNQQTALQSQGQIAAILREIQAVTARVLEQSNQVLLRLGGNGSSH